MADRPNDNRIIIPGDRSQKQPAKGFCRNVQCLESSGAKRFEFVVNADHDEVACPKCGATESPMIGLLTLIHFLHRNPKGKIVGAGGLRWQLACDEPRAYLATMSNDEAASDQLQVVNCPGCLKAAAEKKLEDKQGLVVTG